jgi:uncharacterized integral membrane protein
MVHWLILVPLGLFLLVFAVANRHLVTVSFDPFNSSDPALGVTLPLFVVLILTTIVGVICGSAAVWFGQRHWRRAARQSQAEGRDLRAELQRNRASNLPANLGETRPLALTRQS